MTQPSKRLWKWYPFLVFILVLGMGCSTFQSIWPFNRDKTSNNPVLVEENGENGSMYASESGSIPDDGDDDGDGGGFSFALSEGSSEPQEVTPVEPAQGEPLTEREIQAILNRLQRLEPEPDDQTAFNLPEEVLPPPRPGETIDIAFPPDEAAVESPEVVSGPLRVERFSPEGQVSVAPFISVTFNQPMVPLGTLQQLSEQEAPLQITPRLEGIWRWVGTKTLTFSADSALVDRLPKATEYTVAVPAGVKSAAGNTLAESVTWTFSTPPAVVTRTYPSENEPQGLDPLFFIHFDQRIDPAAVLKTVKVSMDGREIDTRLADQEEIDADEKTAALLEQAVEGRWLAFKSVNTLEKDSEIQVTIGPGTPSAEGPLLTTEAQSYRFRTYAPLAVEESGCAYGNDTCYPLEPFYIRFNNTLDEENFSEQMITIQPEIPGATVSLFGNTLSIKGATAGSTTYYVTVSSGARDVYGQELGQDKKLTFRVGKADSALIGPSDVLVTVDPQAENPGISVYTINHSSLDLQIYAVQPSDWPAFKLFMQEVYRTDNPSTPPGSKVYDGKLRIESNTDVLTETLIDLSPYMDGDYGHFIVLAQAPQSIFSRNSYSQGVQAWVQVTQIGLDAIADHSELVAWATALKDGSPLEGVQIRSDNGGVDARTAEDGLARFAIPATGIEYLTAALGDDTAFLPRSPYVWGDNDWTLQTPEDALRWYVIDDRAMYQPGEEVHVKGFIRLIGGGQMGDVTLPGNLVEWVTYRIIDPMGNDLGSGEAMVSTLGGFDFAFTIPENSNLGYAQLVLRAEGSLGKVDGIEQYHDFQIQEFRRPEFEVEARNETSGPYFFEEDAVVAVEASYYAGGPLSNAEVTWNVSASQTNYQPPNWPDFTFGEWAGWWPIFDESGYSYGETGQLFEGRTDATGAHYLHIDFGGSDKPRAQTVTAQSAVMDVNRQTWAASTSMLVHPASLYVGLRTDRYFIERGQPLEVDLIVVDLDGNPVTGRPIRVTAERMEYRYEKGQWTEKAVDTQECALNSAQEAVRCSFETAVGGRYKITASITDEQGRANESVMSRWVTGGRMVPARDVEQESVTLIPDKESYQPGETARILVQSPFSDAEGLLTVARSGILYTERFTVQEGSATLEIPVEDIHIPNLNVQVDLVGQAERQGDDGEALPGAPTRPAYASGSLELSIPPLSRTLALTVTPQETELAPGGRTSLDLTLTDADGNPVEDAELAVVVVDEAILALTGYELIDPLNIFYYTRSADISSVYGRSSIVLVDPQQLAEARQGINQELAMEDSSMMEAAPAAEAPAMAMGGGAPAAEAQAIDIRTDFNPLALFAPDVTTDAQGKASVPLELPDNLTRYRVMVVAVDGGGRLFGSAETSITARLPLMVRPAATRFLNFGDHFELPVVLQNQTQGDLTVQVAAEALNLGFAGAQGLRVTVPANDRVEVRFPVQTLSAGTASVQVAAVSGEFSDAAQLTLPVYTPATSEAFAVYGTLDDGAAAQPFVKPENVFPQFGGLEISTSSTGLQALTDAVLYLIDYPFDSTEQMASRILGIAALRDVLNAFQAEGLPTESEIDAIVQQDIDGLVGLQNNDGGFAYWRRGAESAPFNSVHAAHALARARQMGYDVPAGMWEALNDYLANIEDHYPSWYSKQAKATISAYALYVRDLGGDTDAAKAARLLDEMTLDGLSLDATAWIWQVLIGQDGYSDELERIRQHAANRVVETAGAANFTTSYADEDYVLLGSNRRTDALLLDAYIRDDPDSDLIPKLVNGLLAHKVKGRWNNTQENVFVLLALKSYFDAYESLEPDFVARVWLGDTYAGSSQFTGYSTDQYQINVPMDYVLDATQTDDLQDLIIQKDGEGRLYYRLGLRYAPTDLNMPPVDMGFVVQRVYEGVDDPDDVRLADDGSWHIELGARVRVRVTMVADSRRYNVALVDPLPAGLEIINPALAVSESLPVDPNDPQPLYRWWNWYQHQNLRDERAEAFTQLLWEGVYEYTYVTRATTPGEFIAPPAKAEEMYAPEMFGRSAADRVVIE